MSVAAHLEPEAGPTTDAKVLAAHLAALYEPVAPGWTFAGFGTEQYVSTTGKPKHGTWNERAFRWPEQADELVAVLVEGAEAGADVYVTPALSENPLRDSKRRKPLAVSTLWADLDGIAHPERVERLVAGGAWSTASGSPDSLHLWVPLVEAVEPAVAADLNRRLCAWLDADPAPAHLAAFLRPAGTLNHKRPTLGTGPSAVVEVHHGPTDAAWSADDLDDLLPAVEPTVAAELVDVEAVAPPADLPPWLVEVLAEPVVEGQDRSARTMAAVGAAVRAGLSDAEVLGALASHRPTLDKYGAAGSPRFRVEVGRALVKVRAEQGAGKLPATSGSSSTPTLPAAPLPANLPPSFWEARPELGHIRAAAWSAARSPDAVLAVVLARVAALTPPTVRLPAPVDTEATFDVAVAVLGPSGTGKSGAGRVGSRLLPIADHEGVAIVPLGSGEGIVAAYLGNVEEVDENGKPHTARNVQVRPSALFTLDEGQALTELGSRRGSTLLPTIRTAWSGDRLGQANASEETRRHLPPGAYRFALVSGWQIEVATKLLDDAPQGTPQRFLFASALDPSIPDEAPPWPGPLPWRRPTDTHATVDLDAEVAAGIRARALARSRGELVVDDLDSHRDLLGLKVAGLLAILDGRHNITAADWNLAAEVLDASDRVRAGIIAAAAWRARQDEQATSARLARRAAHLDHDAAGRAVEKMARAIANHVARGRCEGGCRRRCVTQATASRDRKLAPTEQALDLAVAQGWVAVEGEHIVLGEGTP